MEASCLKTAGIEMPVLNFTGPRKGATPFDRQEMADWLREVADSVEKGEVIGFFYAALHAEPGNVAWDWFTLPPANRYEAIGAIQSLLTEYTAHTMDKSLTESGEPPGA